MFETSYCFILHLTISNRLKVIFCALDLALFNGAKLQVTRQGGLTQALHCGFPVTELSNPLSQGPPFV